MTIFISSKQFTWRKSRQKFILLISLLLERSQSRKFVAKKGFKKRLDNVLGDGKHENKHWKRTPSFVKSKNNPRSGPFANYSEVGGLIEIKPVPFDRYTNMPAVFPNS